MTIKEASFDRRSFNKALLAAASANLLSALPALAQAKSLKIIAPAGPGGGYDQLARTTQEVLTGEKLATSVQVVNVPGAGGTVGLAQFINYRERDPGIMVAGLGLVGQRSSTNHQSLSSRSPHSRGSRANINRCSSVMNRPSRMLGTSSASSNKTPAP
jgi:hypothetical protein